MWWIFYHPQSSLFSPLSKVSRTVWPLNFHIYAFGSWHSWVMRSHNKEKKTSNTYNCQFDWTKINIFSFTDIYSLIFLKSRKIEVVIFMNSAHGSFVKYITLSLLKTNYQLQQHRKMPFGQFCTCRSRTAMHSILCIPLCTGVAKYTMPTTMNILYVFQTKTIFSKYTYFKMIYDFALKSSLKKREL